MEIAKRFKSFANERKRRIIVGAGRCLNYLSLGHMVRNYMASLRCCRCGPTCSSKHAGALRELVCLVLLSSSEDEQRVVRKLTPNINTVLLRTSTVRVMLIPALEGNSCLCATWHCITGNTNF